MSKDFLSLHFAVDQVLSTSGYDLENGRMPCKQKYLIKNMAVEIPILICSPFVYFTIFLLSLLQLQVVLILYTLLDGFSSFQMVLVSFTWFQIVIGRFSSFLTLVSTDSLRLQLPTMTFNNIEIKRENSVKFLGFIIDENLTWKNYIEVIEN